MNSSASIMTCWIAWVKREIGLTRGRAPNNLGNLVQPPPPSVHRAIRDFIEEFRAKEGRIPTYKEVQKGAFLKLKLPSPETDPFFRVENWALETGIPDLAQEHHRYIEEERLMKTIFADTAGWLALGNKSDQWHSRAVGVYQQIARERWHRLTEYHHADVIL